MEIINLKLSEIIPYDKNPRRNDEAVKYVAESIKEFGFKIPIVIDKNNIIVAGHTRYKAAKQLKLKSVPCIKADDLNEEQIKAFRLADNKTGEIAEWDYDLLGLELEDISMDMSLFSFNKDTKDNFIDDLLEDDFVDSEDKNTFNVSFTFPIEKEEILKKYIKSNSKDKIVEIILSEVEQCQNAEAK